MKTSASIRVFFLVLLKSSDCVLLLLYTVLVFHRNFSRGVVGIYLVEFSTTYYKFPAVFVLRFYFHKSTIFWIC